jgi:hypothetical protein
MVQTRGWKEYYIPGLKAAKEALRREYEYSPNRPPPEQYVALVRFYDFFIDFEKRLFEVPDPEAAPEPIDFVLK